VTPGKTVAVMILYLQLCLQKTTGTIVGAASLKAGRLPFLLPNRVRALQETQNTETNQENTDYTSTFLDPPSSVNWCRPMVVTLRSWEGNHRSGRK